MWYCLIALMKYEWQSHPPPPSGDRFLQGLIQINSKSACLDFIIMNYSASSKKNISCPEKCIIDRDLGQFIIVQSDCIHYSGRQSRFGIMELIYVHIKSFSAIFRYEFYEKIFLFTITYCIIGINDNSILFNEQ